MSVNLNPTSIVCILGLWLCGSGVAISAEPPIRVAIFRNSDDGVSSIFVDKVEQNFRHTNLFYLIDRAEDIRSPYISVVFTEPVWRTRVKARAILTYSVEFKTVPGGKTFDGGGHCAENETEKCIGKIMKDIKRFIRSSSVVNN